MAKISLKGNPCNTIGNIPSRGETLPDFTLVNSSLETVTRSSFPEQTLVLNCFPSIDTPVCAQSVKNFNEQAANLPNVKVLCISKDLPFALKRFCGGEGLKNIVPLSAFRDGTFGEALGLTITDGPLSGLLARAVVVLNSEGEVLYSQLVSEIADEPDYKSALAACA